MPLVLRIIIAPPVPTIEQVQGRHKFSDSIRWGWYAAPDQILEGIRPPIPKLTVLESPAVFTTEAPKFAEFEFGIR